VAACLGEEGCFFLATEFDIGDLGIIYLLGGSVCGQRLVSTSSPAKLREGGGCIAEVLNVILCCFYMLATKVWLSQAVTSGLGYNPTYSVTPFMGTTHCVRCILLGWSMMRRCGRNAKTRKTFQQAPRVDRPP
jgi:hypothetical protein